MSMTTLVLPAGTPRETVAILDELARQRIHQIETQGTPADDDRKPAGAWFDLLSARCNIHTDFKTDLACRRDMVELAAVAIAIIEAIDRNGERLARAELP